MASDLTLGPPAAVQADSGRVSTPLPAPPAAPTELPQSKTVTPASGVVAVELGAEQTKRRVVIDQQTHDVIFQVLDANSKVVVEQLPDETALKVRAYFRALEKKEANAALVKADIRV